MVNRQGWRRRRTALRLPVSVLAVITLVVGVLTLAAGGPARAAGADWTLRTAANGNDWAAVAYGDGIYVAVGRSGTGNRVMTSTDGVQWTARVTPADNDWTAITHGDGLFVAVAQSGAGNRVMTSPDGINWTIRSSAADRAWLGVVYAEGLFVAVSNSNEFMTSPDGITWTSRAVPQYNFWSSIAYGNGTFVVVSYNGTGNRAMTSPDGITWTVRSTPVDNAWSSVTYGGGLFAAVSYTGSGDRVMTSPDGITWTSRSSPADVSWRSITHGGGEFVAVASHGSGDRVMTSSDGVTWTARQPASGAAWYGVTHGDDLFVSVAAGAVMTSGPVPVSVTTEPATGIGATTATLKATVNVNADGESTQTLGIRYSTVQAEVSGGGGVAATVVPSQASGDTDTAVQATVTGLSPATTYYYRASAGNERGDVDGAVLSFTTDVAAPSVVTLSATDISGDSATLRATVNAGGGTTDELALRYSDVASVVEGGGGTIASVVPSQVSGTTDTSVVAKVTGLDPAHTYYYRAAARNAAGAAEGAVASFTTSAAPSPTPTTAPTPAPTPSTSTTPSPPAPTPSPTLSPSPTANPSPSPTTNPAPTPELVLVLDIDIGTSLTAAPVNAAGQGMAPGSQISVVMHSRPVELGDIPVRADTSFDGTVTVAQAPAPGAHRLVARGTGADGEREGSTVHFGVAADGTLTGIGRQAAQAAQREADRTAAGGASPVARQVPDSASNTLDGAAAALLPSQAPSDSSGRQGPSAKNTSDTGDQTVEASGEDPEPETEVDFLDPGAGSNPGGQPDEAEYPPYVPTEHVQEVLGLGVGAFALLALLSGGTMLRTPGEDDDEPLEESDNPGPPGGSDGEPEVFLAGGSSDSRATQGPGAPTDAVVENAGPGSGPAVEASTPNGQAFGEASGALAAAAAGSDDVPASALSGTGTVQAGAAVGLGLAAAAASATTEQRKRKKAGLKGSKAKLHKLAYSGSAWGDASRTWRWPATEWLDRVSRPWAEALAPRSPLAGRLLVDGAYLRAMIGSLSLLLPVAGAALALVAVLGNGGSPLPPALGILIALTVIGMWDALAGGLAACVYAIGVVVAGGIVDPDSVRVLLGVTVLWFAVPLIANASRPLRRPPAPGWAFRFDRAADVVIACLIAGLAAQSMVKAWPGLSGLELPVVAEVMAIIGSVLVALLIRIAAESMAARWYPERLAMLAPVKLPFSGKAQRFASLGLRTFIFAFVAVAYLGNHWQLWLGVVLFVVPQIMVIYDYRFPNFEKAHPYVPKGLVKFTLMMIVGVVLMNLLMAIYTDPETLLLNAFVLMALPGIALGAFDLLARDGTKPVLTWRGRILGAVVFVVAVIMILMK